MHFLPFLRNPSIFEFFSNVTSPIGLDSYVNKLIIQTITTFDKKNLVILVVPKFPSKPSLFSLYQFISDVVHCLQSYCIYTHSTNFSSSILHRLYIHARVVEPEKDDLSKGI